MKLDRIKFARLVIHIQYWIGRGSILSQADIDDIDFMTEIDVEPVSTGFVEAEKVDKLLQHINRAGSLIEAIKTYRALTGAGLKESKEAVERYRQPALCQS